jgi:RNA polymerase sigma-70 factor (ECF subfamily)
VVDRILVGDAEREIASLTVELTRFASGLVGRDDGPDVVSAVLVKALSTPAWTTVTNQRAYLYRAVYNEAVSTTRRAGKRRRGEQRAAPHERWDLPTFRPDVRAAVDRLSVQQRAVILLTYWADFDPAGIATRLGISEGSVRRHLARARARLRKVLDE